MSAETVVDPVAYMRISKLEFELLRYALGMTTGMTKEQTGILKTVIERAEIALSDLADSALNYFREKAKAEHQEAGKIEFDGDAAVSLSDKGAYVMGWIWVDDRSKIGYTCSGFVDR